MPVSVTMPALGESVSEGTVTRWLKKEGEQVQADEPLLEVSTDKVDTEIPSPASGILTKIVVAEDETVDVGTELAVIGDSAEDGAAEDGAADDRAADGDSADSDDGDSTDEQAVEAAEEAAAPEPAEQPAEPAPAASEPPKAKAAPSQGGTAVTMPALGESVTEGTVTRWLKSVGDEIAVDEPLLEVSTDKVDTEIPSPVAGTLMEISVNEDETVEVGAQLALIGSGSSSQAEPTEPEKTAEPEKAKEPAAAAEPAKDAPAAEKPQQAKAPAAASEAGAAAYVTPLVRKLAAEHGVDLSTVTGTGVGGRIRKQDVLEAAKPAAEPEAESAPADKPAQPEPVTTGAAPAAGGAKAAAPPTMSPRGSTEKLSRLRRVIATRMVESLQVSAQLTTVVEVDITRVAQLRARAKADFQRREGVKLSFLPFFALATVDALKAHPRVNSSVDMEAGTVTYHDSENLGIAVDTERGLLVPVIHNAGDLNLGGIARKIADLADRTRNNKITPDELGGGTFTLTNTGSRGALFDTPIINQPQSAILGTGTVVKRPIVVTSEDLGEVVTVRSMVYLALSYDHRIIDGADAARFLISMKERLESGDFESDLGLG